VRVTQGGGYTPFASRDGRNIYFLKDDSRDPPLWKTPAEGGETQVLDSLSEAGFAETRVGIHFVRQARLQFLDFSTGLSKPIVGIDKPTALGLTASPDNHWLLLTVRNEGSSVLMLVDNFR